MQMHSGRQQCVSALFPQLALWSEEGVLVQNGCIVWLVELQWLAVQQWPLKNGRSEWLVKSGCSEWPVKNGLSRGCSRRLVERACFLS